MAWILLFSLVMLLWLLWILWGGWRAEAFSKSEKPPLLKSPHPLSPRDRLLLDNAMRDLSDYFVKAPERHRRRKFNRYQLRKERMH